MTAVLILDSLDAALEHTSGGILNHVAALHALGVQIVVSVSGKGRLLADTLEDRNIPYSVSYADITIEKSDSVKHTSPLGQQEGRCIR